MPGSAGAVRDLAAAEAAARAIGYPVLIKASAGGGGRGMKVARDRGRARPHAADRAKRGGGVLRQAATVYLERHLERPRHIEIQILGDGQGGDRSSRRARLLAAALASEGAGRVAVAGAQRRRARPARRARRRGVTRARLSRALGTLEFLYQDGDFFFIEMNTRLQVEHPITEMVSGIDLVREQLRIAAGAPLGYRQADVKLRGHAIECRINAENPDTFTPSPGRVTDYHAPGGLGVRVDSALYHGYEVPPTTTA